LRPFFVSHVFQGGLFIYLSRTHFFILEKQQLRQQAIILREKLTRAEFWQLNDALLKQFSAFDWSAIKTVHLFLPIVERREVDTFEFINFLKINYPQIQMVVPRCDFKTREMESIAFDPDATVLIKNKHQIPEPLYGDKIKIKSIDAVIIPLLAFDLKGHRVGYGAGFYDRFLEQCKPSVLKIGVSLFKPVKRIADPHDQDILLTHCITAEQVYEFLR